MPSIGKGERHTQGHGSRRRPGSPARLEASGLRLESTERQLALDGRRGDRFLAVSSRESGPRAFPLGLPPPQISPHEGRSIAMDARFLTFLPRL